MSVIHFFPFLFSYLSWHYTRGLGDLIAVFRNLLWFDNHVFSIPLLFKTLLSPWKRLNESYGRGLDISKLGQTIIVNTLMRLVGAFIKTITIFVGFLFGILIIAFSIFGVFVWVLLPLLIPLMFLSGAYMLLLGQTLFFL